MIKITQICADEIIEALVDNGVPCDELWFKGDRYSYHGGFLEGESKWCLRLCVDADDKYSDIESLGSFDDRFGRRCVPPHSAMEYLACIGYLPIGEYLVWRSW